MVAPGRQKKQCITGLSQDVSDKVSSFIVDLIIRFIQYNTETLKNKNRTKLPRYCLTAIEVLVQWVQEKKVDFLTLIDQDDDAMVFGLCAAEESRIAIKKKAFMIVFHVYKAGRDLTSAKRFTIYMSAHYGSETDKVNSFKMPVPLFLSGLKNGGIGLVAIQVPEHKYVKEDAIEATTFAREIAGKSIRPIENDTEGKKIWLSDGE